MMNSRKTRVTRAAFNIMPIFYRNFIHRLYDE